MNDSDKEKHKAIILDALQIRAVQCQWCGPTNGLHACNCPNAPDRYFMLKLAKERKDNYEANNS